jgi:PAS domain S-box-containing protein
MNASQYMENTIHYSEKGSKVLVVDNDAVSRAETSHLIEKLGHIALIADNGDACIELLNTCWIDLLMIDIDVPGKNGMEVLAYIREHQITIPVIVTSISNDIDQAVESLKSGAYQFMRKPVKATRLEATIKNALSEFELRRKVRLFSAAMTQIPLGVVITNEQGIIEYTNPGFTALSGYTEQEVEGQSIGILKSGNQSSAFYRKFWDTISSGNIWQGEIINRKKSGELYTEYCIVSPITDRKAGITHFISIKQDITLRKKEQEALAESEQRFHELADLLPQPVYEIDLKGSITFANKPGLEMFGYHKSEIENEFDGLRLFAPEERERVQSNILSIMRGIPVDNHEYIAQKKDGTTFPILIYSIPIIRSGNPAGLRGIGLDISERKRTEERLKELNQTLEERVKERTQELEISHQQMALQEKLASIGQLSAGLAHEINNPINFVRINFATLQEDISDLRTLLQEYRSIFRSAEQGIPTHDELQKLTKMEKELSVDMLLDDLPEIFAESERGFERISTIIGSMRNFSFRHAINQRVPFDINKGIRDTLVIARNEYRYFAKVETDLDDLPPLQCNPEQINQVFLNLLINSAHAIASQKRDKKGRISIRTSADSSTISCVIADDGPGMSSETMRRIFEPFFTTKEPGKGTGLGLSISYDIITNKHGGTLTVSCPPEGGTVFTIQLPLTLTKESEES